MAEGTPNRVRATAGAERPRALRARRSVHESREWARCVRYRSAGANVGLAERLCSTRTFTCWCRSSCMHTRRWYRRLQSCEAAQEQNRSLMDAAGRSRGLRLRGCATLPLTLFAQWSGTTTADTGSIHDAQASIGFSALFMRDQLLVSGATQRPICLERKVLAREATSFPGQAHMRGSVARRRSCVW